MEGSLMRFVWDGGKRHPHLLWRLKVHRWEVWWARPLCFGIRDRNHEPLAATLATLVPAIRAARVSPMEALRPE